MKNLFYPYNYADSVFAIDYEKLYNKGFRAVIFDIDNTLVFQDADSNKETENLFEYIHSLGLKTFILSNNSEERVKRFALNVNSLYLSKAFKPFKSGYRKALKKLCVTKDEALFIGDRILTDILGANSSGIASILVKYIRSADGENLSRIRKLESVIIKRYEKNGKAQNRLGNIEKDQN